MAIEHSDSMEFRLTDNHIRLMRRMCVNWNDCETGAPEIDPKRPYGNRFVAGDIADILGIDLDDEGEDAMLDLHREMDGALQVVLSTGSFQPGLYRRKAIYSNEWERVEETP